MSELFRFLVKRFLTQLSKLNPTCPQEILEEKFFFKQNFSCSYRFQKWAKKVRPSGKIFRQGCANCFRPVCRFILKSFFVNDQIHFIIVAHWANRFGIQSEIFQHGLQKELSKVLIVSGHWAKSFRPFVKKCCRATKTAFCVLTGIFWTKKTSWKKVLGFFFIFFADWAKKFWLLINFFSTELSKVYSTCPWEHFDKKCFRKNSLRFQFFFGLPLEIKSPFRQAFFGRFE